MAMLQQSWMDAFVQIKGYERKYKVEMDVPKIVVVGVESAGKSTLLSAIVGLPLTFTQDETGTRCPVRYCLRHGPDEEVKVQGKASLNQTKTKHFFKTFGVFMSRFPLEARSQTRVHGASVSNETTTLLSLLLRLFLQMLCLKRLCLLKDHMISLGNRFSDETFDVEITSKRELGGVGDFVTRRRQY